MNQLNENQNPPMQRLLRQVHPPPQVDGPATLPPDFQEARSPEESPALRALTQEQDYWEGRYRLSDGKTVFFQARRVGQQVHLWMGGETFVFSPITSASRGRASQQISTDEVLCSVPGVVIAVHVSEGDTVEAGQELLVIESMKTEQVVKSPRDGTIQRVPVQPGDRVDRGMRLMVLVPLEAE